MRQLKDIQILYAFHIDPLPRNEHDTRARFLPRSLEFPKRRNDLPAACYAERNRRSAGTK